LLTSASNGPQMRADQVFRQNPRLAQQELGGKAVVLHFEGHRMLGLNETGSRIWSLLDGSRTLGQIADEIAVEFGTPREALEGDVLLFVRDLAERDLVVSIDIPPPVEGPRENPAKTGRVSEETK